MDNNTDNLFHPSLEKTIMKMDPEDGKQIMEYFKAHALLSREKALLQASIREQKKLLVENAKLKSDIEQLRSQLQDKQEKKRRAGKASLSQAPPPNGRSLLTEQPSPKTADQPLNPSSSEGRDRRGRRRRGERRAPPTSEAFRLGAEPRVDASRLDLRVGRILSVRPHPLSDGLSVQEVDVGENEPRRVVSKLGGETRLEEGPLVVVLCNVKASKLRGVVSQARLLCCSASDDDVEMLVPPTGSAPGDRVTFLSYPGEPDRELQSKERVWELLKPDLQVDCRGVANYKGCAFEVKGKGLCRAPSLVSCTIR
ncbi:Aminoacyl tRNA synthase complex-interacting multifunctional protein 1 [Oryzias melastigma]|uniref:Aminoacyl tRNA synthase complex-interacting multifunctional protein 1 n=1 Tax=Oryzias melastigma TaxID=30732 RepID=A0A834L1D9_ORYME|nr:Aminoacyl tRNA synthase complex-interacting multifunctional protein 1 [Oryzias melastigma]